MSLVWSKLTLDVSVCKSRRLAPHGWKCAPGFVWLLSENLIKVPFQSAFPCTKRLVPPPPSAPTALPSGVFVCVGVCGRERAISCSASLCLSCTCDRLAGCRCVCARACVYVRAFRSENVSLIPLLLLEGGKGGLHSAIWASRWLPLSP